MGCVSSIILHAWACADIEYCAFADVRPIVDAFDRAPSVESLQALSTIADERFLHAKDALQCRVGGAAVFWRLAQVVREENSDRSHNLNQLAMSFFWDMSRMPNGLQCLERGVWNLRFDVFMEEYLTLAHALKRNTVETLRAVKTVDKTYRHPKWRIAVTSVCAYPSDHMLHGLYDIVKQNRDNYTRLHGYRNELWNVTFDASRHPVWSAVGLPLSLLGGDSVDWVVALDCDMMFIDMERTIDSILATYDAENQDVHFFISEDGRGLAGGAFIVRNSVEAATFLKSVYAPGPYDDHDLRDQWSFLWHLVRPGATKSSEGFGYPSFVRLLPQQWLNSYPWALCRPSHRCFDDDSDFIVSFISLSSLSKEVALAMVNKFLHQSMESHARLQEKISVA